MNLRVLGALLRKEVNMMKRNPLIPRIILGLPFVVLLVIPLVASFDVKDVGVTVVDNDRSQLSRRIIADMDATAELHVASVSSSFAESMEMIEEGEADVVLSIPPHFSRDLSELDVEANGVNAIKGTLGMQYVVASISNTLTRWRVENGLMIPDNVTSVVDRYNPTLSYRNYMIPALMVFLIIMICGFLPALNLVSEKESGTIEAMNVTPVSRITFVLSKLIPFWIVGLVVVTIGILVGRVVYGLVPLGSPGAIYLAAVLLSLVMSGLGVAIANKSATMLQSIFVLFAVIMIFQLMGGLFTPVGSMPQWAQYVTYAIPPRYFNEIMRAVYLKGATISELRMQYLCLTFFAFVALATAALTYRKRA
ncbi:MAG: ABC transporter permease [Bacteroidales bacterium]|nr:ABC transporter permease [Bacteroidales bacterium]